jgi:hypothetical protein
MKNKMHRDLPWKPMHWVGGKTPINLSELSDDTVEKYAAVKATSAIFRAMRK